jgi:ADP-ribose pyrophosphatase
MKNPKILSEDIKFKGNFFYIASNKVKLNNKKIVNWDFIDFIDDSVSIVAIDDKENIYLSSEWRNAWNKRIISTPVGHVKKGMCEKDNIKQARNELREEVGFDAKRIEKLVTIMHGLKIRHKVHIYLATGLFKSPKEPDPDEFVEVVKMPFEKALKMFLTGKEETTGYTILGMLLAKKLKVK